MYKDVYLSIMVNKLADYHLFSVGKSIPDREAEFI